MSKSKLVILDEIGDNKALAYRNKPSVEIYTENKEVSFSEFSYSFEEVIALGKKLEKLSNKTL